MRFKQNKKKILIALIAGLFAAMIIFQTFSKNKSEINELNRQLQEQNDKITQQSQLLTNINSGAALTNMNSNRLVVAKTDLAAGTKLDASVIDYKEFKPYEIPNGAFNIGDQVVGSALTANVKAGEAITKMKIASGGDESSLNIPVGTRAITVPIDFVQGMASYINVGSKVDIISLAKAENGQPGLILQNIKIIHFERAAAQPGTSTTSSSGATAVTFEIPAALSARFVEVINQGKIQIIARNMSDNRVVPIKLSRKFSGSSNSGSLSSLKIAPPPPPPGLKLDNLPEPGTPGLGKPGKKVEIIQANVKNEVTFD